MKKIYLLFSGLLLASAGVAQNGQVPNGGFENWSTNAIYDYTTSWGCSNQNEYRGVATTLKSKDAQIGTYSAELIAAEVGSMPDTTFGYVYQGVLGQGGPQGGITYASNFDQVKFQYKCDLPLNDSLFLLIIRFDAMGNMTDMQMLSAAFGTHNTWTQGSVALPAGTQSSLFLAFILGNPFGGPRPTPGAWARIDNGQMFNAGSVTTNVPDPSFEAWSSQTTETPDSWYTMNEMLAGNNMENLNKSTIANSGTYAAEISTIQFPPMTGDTIGGYISWGPVDFNNWMNPFTPAPYNASPTTFSGAYQYTYSSMTADQGSIQVMFYEMGAMIGQVGTTFMPTMGYSAFSLPITMTGTPDSIVMFAYSGQYLGSVLLLDDLSLSGGNVGIEEFEKFDVSVYPNPASDVVMIKSEGTFAYELIDITGNILATSSDLNGAQTVDVSSFAAGTYMIRLTNQNGTEIHQLVIE